MWEISRSRPLKLNSGMRSPRSEQCIVNDRDSGRSRGFGFVEMSNGDEAGNAMAGLNGRQMGDRTLCVSEARPKEDRPARGSFNGGKRR